VIGIQLDLFVERVPAAAAAADVEPADDARPQLDLFGDRHVQLESARRALIDGRAAAARRELLRLRRTYPADAVIAAELAQVRSFERRLAEIETAFPGERARLLVALGRVSPPGLRASLLRRAAVALAAGDPSALVDGKSASCLLLQAGDLEAAWHAADAAARHCRSARLVAYLGDVEHALDRPARARERYREALALDPHDVDWDELADEEVRSLPDIARTELELADGAAWAAPVGAVLGVLPIGDPPPPLPPGAGRQAGAAALGPARRFLAALTRAAHAHGADRIAARREMRALAPQLLAAYLQRLDHAELTH
jgi:tetratricopeptide (TPR) repeat protein